MSQFDPRQTWAKLAGTWIYECLARDRPPCLDPEAIASDRCRLAGRAFINIKFRAPPFANDAREKLFGGSAG